MGSYYCRGGGLKWERGAGPPGPLTLTTVQLQISSVVWVSEWSVSDRRLASEAPVSLTRQQPHISTFQTFINRSFLLTYLYTATLLFHCMSRSSTLNPASSRLSQCLLTYCLLYTDWVKQRCMQIISSVVYKTQQQFNCYVQLASKH